MRQLRWRAVLIALAAIAPFVPMLLRGEVPAFRDHRDYYVPLREQTAEALRGLELPLWNALSGSGEPWLANPQTGVFYPPVWIVAASRKPLMCTISSPFGAAMMIVGKPSGE